MGLFTLAGVTLVVVDRCCRACWSRCIGTGLFNPAVTNVALSSVPVEQSGVAAGVNDTFRQAGIAVGVAALGALIPAEAALGGGSAAEYVDGLHDALWAGAGLAAHRRVAAGAADLQALRRRGRDAAPRRPAASARWRRSRPSPSLDLARDHLRDRERGGGRRRRRVEHVHGAAGAGEQEVVDQRAVAADRLRAVAARARASRRRRRSPGRTATPRASAAGGSRRAAISVMPVRHQRAHHAPGAGPAQRRAQVDVRRARAAPSGRSAPRRRSCARGARRGTAAPGRAPGRSGRARARALGREPQVGAAERHDAHVGPRARRRARAGPTTRRRRRPRARRGDDRAVAEHGLHVVLALDQRAHAGAARGSRRRAPRCRARRRPRPRRSRPSRCSASAAPTGRARRARPRAISSGPEPREALDAVGPRPALELVQARQVVVAHRDHELAAAHRLDPVRRAVLVQRAPRPPRTAAPSASRARSRCRRG